MNVLRYLTPARLLTIGGMGLFLLILGSSTTLPGQDLAEIRSKGVLRHGGIPYANFNDGNGGGLDMEMMREFAKSLGVRYEFVSLDWSTLFESLCGNALKVNGDDVTVLGNKPIRIDVAACGITVLPWRQKVVDFSDPTFLTQVWLVSRSDGKLHPIKPSGRLEKDIEAVKLLLTNQTVLCKSGTCLAPENYNLTNIGATAVLFGKSLNELAPAILKPDPKERPAEMTLLDVPDTLVAMQNWEGDIKVIGPISGVQDMSAAFRKASPKLRQAFNKFFTEKKQSGFYDDLVRKHYPSISNFFPNFFPTSKLVSSMSTNSPPPR